MILSSPKKDYKEWQNNDGLTSVGDTIPRFTLSTEQEQLELVTLNIIYSVVMIMRPKIYNIIIEWTCGTYRGTTPLLIMLPHSTILCVGVWCTKCGYP